MRILVLRGGAVGDFLVTLPMLGLLRARWPGAAIELVGNARAGALGVRSGCLDAVHSQDQGRWGALAGDGPLPGELERWLAAFDLVINFWPDPDGALARRFPIHPGQRYLSGAAVPAVAPAARHFCEVLRPLGLQTLDFRARLPAPVVARSAIALHPGSGSPRKNWSIGRWRELAGRLAGPVLVVLGPAELDRPEISAAFPADSGRLVVSRALPLAALADQLAGCRAFVGHDSGLSHLAAAVGTPCVLLFGPSDPATWAPPGDHVQVVRQGPDLAAIGVAAVEAAVRRALALTPAF